MKKLFSFLAVAFVMLMVTSCGSKQGPKQVVESAITCLQNQDYKGFVTYMFDEELTAEDEAAMELTLGMIQGKMGPMLEQKGGIDSFKVVSEEIDGDTASVKVEYEYANGESDSDTFNLNKLESGVWVINLK